MLAILSVDVLLDHLRSKVCKNFIATFRVEDELWLRQHHPKIIDSAVFGRTTFSMFVSL